MATRPSIPYYAPAELLPAPLPTVAEIRASKQRLSEWYETPVVRVGDHYAVKYGRLTSIQQGENMLFVKQSSSVPVLTVYAIFEDEETRYAFIVMEYIPGRNLEGAWKTLGAAEKRDIVSQLRRHMDALRSIPSPGYYGGFWRQRILDHDFLIQDVADFGYPYPEPELWGPFETEEQWADGMWRCLHKARNNVLAQKNVSPGTVDRYLAYLRRQYHAVFKGHKPVFTHAKFQRDIVLLREDGTVAITGWTHAGWYPSFWEYCASVAVLGHHDDWDEMFFEILDEYAAELGWFIHHRATIEW
ncbi:bbb90e00-17a7-4728-b438-2e998f4753d2 [Thermothielavioides terrestris]|uniref:Aminoglycoside phosphotransferase domain-containing protein n=2 Tax=Thermothielavioides terrestris TaxID=2587410 RepID=G2RAM2_THETT|nr:uncharacterized protein THITE_2118696 [Thermothielavioides terrestris NRRL 8126]AEO68900.1 hypothetical protein THITE_2118696 [Thermothielavioides terrestris NRRL 8126]SPQ22829.1 bbb90e00-17a7-4728-b438-2e998f4753d2 [Thermothielavioides terrestris]